LAVKSGKAALRPLFRHTSGEKKADVAIRVPRVPIVDVRAIRVGIADIDELAIPGATFFAQFHSWQKHFVPQNSPWRILRIGCVCI